MMKPSEQTTQQIERFLKKIAQKFPANEDTSLVTDVHIRVSQDSGEMVAFDDDDKEDRPCVAASKRKIEAWQKEHPGNSFNLKVFSDTLKKYADELGLEFGDVYYYLVVEDDKADEMGVRV